MATGLRHDDERKKGLPWRLYCRECQRVSPPCAPTLDRLLELTREFRELQASGDHSAATVTVEAAAFLDVHGLHELSAMDDGQTLVHVETPAKRSAGSERKPVPPAGTTGKDALKWGYYCRTCGESSPIYGEVGEVCLSAVAMGVVPHAADDEEDMTLPTVTASAAVFLARHLSHDLWLECESGVLRLRSGRAPVGRATRLPGFSSPYRSA